MAILLNILIGVSLAATCGFRIFVPLLVMGIAAQAGYLDLGSGFQWIGTGPAIVVLAIATVMEVLAYFFPFVDNLLISLSAPISVLAGILVSAAVMTDISPMLQWALAIIAGGGAAAATNLVSNGVHHSSTAMSAGTLNPLVSAFESGLAVLTSVLAVAAPLLALICIAAVVFFILKGYNRLKRSWA
ncbi:MAG: DUF4126 domain-containing protein [Syntrophomonadaceae bacterium]